MIRAVLFLLIVAVPIVEIAVIIAVGQEIGVLPTIGIVILTAIIGSVLLKRQGAAAVARLRADVQQDRVPAAAIGHAITIAVAGVLLLTPGFVTDAFGFALFVPAVRAWLWRQIKGSVEVHQAGPGGRMHPGAGRRDPGVIDLDASAVSRADAEANTETPWRDRSS